MSEAKGAGGRDQREAARADVAGMDRLAQRTTLITSGPDGRQREHRCRITDASDTGYRIVLITADQEAGTRHFTPEQELLLEHVDGWQREVQVRWVRHNMLGLRILRSITRLVMPNGTMHNCVILGWNGSLCRIETEVPVEALEGVFELERSNGERRPVRVRWHLEGEICLQEAQFRKRL